MRTSPRLHWRPLLAMVTGAGLIASMPGCTASKPGPDSVPIPVRWRSALLPTSSPDARVTGLVFCAGRWYAVGAQFDAAPSGLPVGPGQPLDATGNHPAAWVSTDALRWSTVPLHPVSAYGPYQSLTSVACGPRGRVVAVGAAPGGAHGNPRTSTWLGDAAGLVEQPSAFELFGGPDAIGVGQVAGGPDGFVIVGARIPAQHLSTRELPAGAAVWSSPDGRSFTLIDNDPQLRSSATERTEAFDAVDLAGYWTVVGDVWRVGTPGAARAPLAWLSTDRLSWQRMAVDDGPVTGHGDGPVTGHGPVDDEAMQRVVRFGTGLLAVGVRGRSLRVWRAEQRAGTWHYAGALGSAGDALTGLAAGTAVAVAAVTGDTGDSLWWSAEGTNWGRLTTPPGQPTVAHPATGSQPRAVPAAGGYVIGVNGSVLLAAAGARVWLADLSQWSTPTRAGG